MLAQYNLLAEAFESAVCRMILFALSELPKPLGVRKTIAYLQGKKSSFIVESELHQLSSYATLPFFSREQLQVILERMMAHHLLEIVFTGHQDLPVICVTDSGKKSLQGSGEKTAIHFLEDFIDRSVPQFEGAEADLFDRLKRQRRILAEKYEVPAFMICGDVVLRYITKCKPLSREELLGISGVGEIFLQKYGDDFLNVIRQYRREVG